MNRLNQEMFANLCQRLLVGRQHPALSENRVLGWNLFTHRDKFINLEQDSHTLFVHFKMIFTNSFKSSTSLLPVLTPSGSAGSLPAPNISSSLALEKVEVKTHQKAQLQKIILSVNYIQNIHFKIQSFSIPFKNSKG